jgi:hypothetical protein
MLPSPVYLRSAPCAAQAPAVPGQIAVAIAGCSTAADWRPLSSPKLTTLPRLISQDRIFSALFLFPLFVPGPDIIFPNFKFSGGSSQVVFRFAFTAQDLCGLSFLTTYGCHNSYLLTEQVISDARCAIMGHWQLI